MVEAEVDEDAAIGSDIEEEEGLEAAEVLELRKKCEF